MRSHCKVVFLSPIKINFSVLSTERSKYAVVQPRSHTPHTDGRELRKNTILIELVSRENKIDKAARMYLWPGWLE